MRVVAALCVSFLLALSAHAAPNPNIDPAETPAPESTQLPPAEPGVVDLFRAYGLFGTFAPDCGQPAAPTNPHVSVAQQDGSLVIETHDVGQDYANNLYSVRAARRLSDDRLEIKVVFVPGTQSEEFQTIELQAGKGTRRTLYNRVDGGAVRVNRGVAVANGKRTPLLKKCE